MSTASLSGKTVLVTGAARGIGEHVARQAAARGARLVLVGLEPQRLAALAGELGDGHLWARADVTSQPELDRAVRQAVEATGRLDVVVANAGIAPIGTIAMTDVDAHVRTIDVNLSGVIRTVSATLAHVRETRGYYLLMSSTAAFTALPGMAAYCAAKAGVEHFGNALRLETAGIGVGVGTAHPIWIDTDLVRNMRDDLPSFRTALAKLPGPLGRVVAVGDCAAALVRGIERRKRRIYVPRSIGAIQAMRTVLSSRLVEALTVRAGGDQVGRLESEAGALRRSFGAHVTDEAGAFDEHQRDGVQR